MGETVLSLCSCLFYIQLHFHGRPSKPCQTTIKAHDQGLHSGQQAGGALHTMLVLQAYQAQLLKAFALCATK